MEYRRDVFGAYGAGPHPYGQLSVRNRVCQMENCQMVALQGEILTRKLPENILK